MHVFAFFCGYFCFRVSDFGVLNLGILGFEFVSDFEFRSFCIAF
jgi:hypothetical protein